MNWNELAPILASGYEELPICSACGGRTVFTLMKANANCIQNKPDDWATQGLDILTHEGRGGPVKLTVQPNDVVRTMRILEQCGEVPDLEPRRVPAGFTFGAGRTRIVGAFFVRMAPSLVEAINGGRGVRMRRP